MRMKGRIAQLKQRCQELEEENDWLQEELDYYQVEARSSEKGNFELNLRLRTLEKQGRY